MQNRIEQAKAYLIRARADGASQDLAKVRESVKNFTMGIKLVTEQMKESTDAKYKATLKQKILQLNAELNKIKAKTEKLEAANQSQQKQSSSHSSSIYQGKQSEDQIKLRQTLSAAIVREKPNVSWNEVSGLSSAKQALKQAVVLPMIYPQVFVGQRRPWRGILLYGPPGTGKTLLAKACATQMSGGTFLSVSASSLVSKYVGESQKLIKYLFDLARHNRPSVIFMDEIDSIASNRTQGGAQSTRKLITELLVQMQGVGNSMDGVLVLGATNLPWLLDPAIRRRFQKKIYIDLPDKQARAIIIRNKLANIEHNLTDQDIDELAADLQHFSGSDISVLVKDSIYVPLRQVQSATWFRKNKADLWVVAKEGEPGAIQTMLTDLPGGSISLRKVTCEDFAKAKKRIMASVSPQSLANYEQFTNKFGERNSCG